MPENIFEELLTKIDDKDRASLSEIAGRNPAINDYLADPAGVKRVQEVRTWYAGHWDIEHGCTKEEYARKLRIDSLEAELAARPQQGEEMNLAELDKFLDDKIAAGHVVSPALMKTELGAIGASIAEKEKLFDRQLNVIADAATEASYLAARHLHDHGEVLDTRDLFTKAVEAKATDLRGFYETNYAKDKIEAKRTAAAEKSQAELDAKIAAAREEGRKSALQERVGQEGHMPTVEGGPEMGHFQQRMTAPKLDAEGKPIAQSLELGRNQVSRMAAIAADRAEAAGTAA